MKLFGIIVAAILTAAAIIWGVVAWRAKVAEDEAHRFNALKNMASSAKITLEHLTITDDLSSPLRYARHSAAADFRRLINENPRADGTWNVTFDFNYNYRTIIETIRKRAGDGTTMLGAKEALVWAEGMEKALDAEGFSK